MRASIVTQVGIVLSMAVAGCSREQTVDSSTTTTEFTTAAPGGTVDPSLDPTGGGTPGVTIVRDGEGVPHIFADGLLDVFRGLGWAQARDRMFQMDFSRRFTEGRLSELFWEDPGMPPDAGIVANNEKLIAFDSDMRRFSFAHHNEEVFGTLSPVYRSILIAFTEGVNEYLDRNSFELPPMYSSLGFPASYEIEPWEPVDSLNVWDRITYLFEPGNLLAEIINLNDLQQNGYISCPCPSPKPVDEGGTVIVEPPGGMWATSCDELSASLELGRGLQQELQFVASHTFALAPDKSTSEGPLIFGDPKIDVSAPSIFYPYHIAQFQDSGDETEGRLNVQGIGFAGAPGMVIFWNDYLSQTVTSAGGDLWDLFELTPDSCGVAGPDVGAACYRFGSAGGPQTTRFLEERTEIIRTRFGGPSTTITVQTSHHGPIVNEVLVKLWSKVWPPQPLPDFLDENSPFFRYFALKHAEQNREGMHSLVASVEAMRSTRLDRYFLAMSDWVGPVVHAVFAVVDQGLATDDQGSIGYIYAGGIPCRPRLPAPSCSVGSTTVAEMRGRMPFNGSIASVDWGPLMLASERPHVLNPPEGYVFAGNNLAAGDWYNSQVYTGQRGAGDTFRSMTIRTKLKAHFRDNAVMTPQEAWNLHSDASSVQAKILTDWLQHIATLDDTGEFIQAPSPPNGPAGTDQEKAFKALQALSCWADGQYQQSSAYKELLTEVLNGLVREGRYNLSDPGANSSKMSCKWNEGEGGACYVLKSFEEEPSNFRLYENDGFTPTIETTYITTIAIAAWEQMVSLGKSNAPCTWPSGLVEDYVVPYQLNFFCPSTGSSNCELGDLLPGEEIIASLDKSYKATLNSAQASAYPSLIIYKTGDNTNYGYFPCGLHENPQHPLFVNPDVLALWEADSRCELTLDGPIQLPENPLDPDIVLVQPDTYGRVHLAFTIRRKDKLSGGSNAAGPGIQTSGSASRP